MQSTETVALVAGLLMAFLPGNSADEGGAREIRQLEQACRQGKAAACAELGDHPRAVALWRPECQRGDAQACHGIAMAYLLGAAGGERADGELQARAFFWKACGSGMEEACERLHVALAELGAGCAAGIAAECRILGEHETPARALDLFRKACEAGDVGGCYDLARVLDAGRGRGPDERVAAELYRRACDAGHGGSCAELGRRAEEGLGVPRDPKRAVALYAIACRQDEWTEPWPAGGVMVAESELKADNARSQATREAIGAAGAHGLDEPAGACLRLGLILERDEVRDSGRAAEAYRRACSLGSKDACRWTGGGERR